jgi:hypothetical protein
MNPGTNCRVQEDTIERFAMGRLIGSSLNRFEQHLLLCGDCQRRVEEAEQYVAVIRHTLREMEAAKTGAERRREPRRVCRSKVQLSLPGSRRRVVAEATDMSRSGLGLTLGVKMLAGAKVLLALGARRLQGEVAWCAPVGEQYRAGVRLMAA